MANADEQVLIITSWFGNWDGEQRLQFMDNIGPLLEQYRTCNGSDMDCLAARLQTLDLHTPVSPRDMARQTVFQCQLNLCRMWINIWSESHIRRVMQNIEQICQLEN